MSDINKIVYGAIQNIHQYPFDGDINGVDKQQKMDHFTDGVVPNEFPDLKFGEDASTLLQKQIQNYIKH
jgi:hypothetical protein